MSTSENIFNELRAQIWTPSDIGIDTGSFLVWKHDYKCYTQREGSPAGVEERSITVKDSKLCISSMCFGCRSNVYSLNVNHNGKRSPSYTQQTFISIAEESFELLLVDLQI